MAIWYGVLKRWHSASRCFSTPRVLAQVRYLINITVHCITRVKCLPQDAEHFMADYM
jgi:hypothetical protein